MAWPSLDVSISVLPGLELARGWVWNLVVRCGVGGVEAHCWVLRDQAIAAVQVVDLGWWWCDEVSAREGCPRVAGVDGMSAAASGGLDG